MKQIFFILILAFLSSCDSQQVQDAPLSVDFSNELVNPKHYIVTKTNQEMVIDGRANEASWQEASFSESFIDIEGIKIPKFDTKMKMLWDENFLYVFAQMEEPHVWGNLKQRDTVIFYNNDFEVFIDPSGNTRNYAEIEINSLGTVWDLLLDKPYRAFGKANNHWNLDNLKTAIHVQGTLNDHQDIDSLWTVEMAIPMDALIELKNKPRFLPKEGEQWRINFSRVQWDFDIVNDAYQRKKNEDGKYLREYNWVWSNQKVINMHEPEKWGYLQFTNEKNAKAIEFIKDKNHLTNQISYALYRQTRFGSLKHLLDKEVGTVQEILVNHSDAETIPATFFKTNLGFEYKIISPENKQVFIINETGSLTVK